MTDIIRIKNAYQRIYILNLPQNILNMEVLLVGDIYPNQFKDNEGLIKDDKTFPAYQFVHLIKNADTTKRQCRLRMRVFFHFS